MIRVGLVDGGAIFIDPDKVGPARFDVSELTVDAVAHGLSQVSRFGGQTPRIVTDAEHSVHLAQWFLRHPQFQFSGPRCRYALLHDVCECLGVGDVHYQVKRAYGTLLRGLECDLMDAIWDHIEDNWVSSGNHTYLGPAQDRVPGVPDYVRDVVHKYDKWIGDWEAYQVWPLAGEGRTGVEEIKKLPYGYRPRALQYWSAERAKAEWLSAWRAYGGLL